MEVKGNVVVVLPKFIKEHYGEDGYKKWLNTLSENSKSIFNSLILSSSWYELQGAFIEPTIKIGEVFYGGDTRQAALEIGRASADYSFSGVLRFLVRFGTPEFTIKRASTIMSSMHRPCRMETVEVKKGRAIIRITEYPEIQEVIELRLKGYMEKAATYTGAKNVKIEITSSLANKDPYTEFVLTWQ